MKKLHRRAYSALLVALCLLFGMGVYVWRFATQGRAWAEYTVGEVSVSQGSSVTGKITDRNGLVLADVSDGKRVFADDEAIRTALVHAVGDRERNIGTGALTLFAKKLSSYSPVTGLDPDGASVALSLDAELCAAAYEALAGRKGAVGVMDYTTGEMLCMVSSPAFDPDVGIDPLDVQYDGAYLNRLISAAYPPGSTFKLVTLAAAIETMPDLYERRFTCDGTLTVDGNQITCTAVHGSQTIEQALANSCNCAFAELALELGGDTLALYAKQLGLTGRLTMDGTATAAGRFDAADDGSADLAWSGVGQSTDLVCPLAMLRLSAAIANGGTAAKPTMLLEGKTEKSNIMSTSTSDKLKAMMNYNVAAAYGQWNYPGLALCAKSGTAEVGDGTSHAWFTGFLDDEAHPWAFVVVIENGGGGARVAGPVANEVLQKAIELFDGADK